MRQKIIHFLLIITLFFASLAIPQKTAQAQSSVTAADMISLVNGWRTGTYSLPALVENNFLDTCAQTTASEMASIQAKTHLGLVGYPDAKTRCAQLGFGNGKIVHVTENIAYDTAMTMTKLIDYWADADHYLPASDAQYLYVGAAVASANGETYYVLEAGTIDGETVASSSGTNSSTSDVVATPVPTSSDGFVNPVVVSTPSSNGMIYHVVKSGEVLFNIALAYGITLDYLKQENKLTTDQVNAGTILTIKSAPTPTVTSTFTLTPVYPTRTPTLTPQPQTPTPAPTSTPTPKPSLIEKVNSVDRPSLGLVLAILSALGLAAVVYFGFIRSGNPQPVPPAPVKPLQPEVKQPEPVVKKKTTRKKKEE